VALTAGSPSITVLAICLTKAFIGMTFPGIYGGSVS
jgi:hypothetical protein